MAQPVLRLALRIAHGRMEARGRASATIRISDRLYSGASSDRPNTIAGSSERNAMFGLHVPEASNQPGRSLHRSLSAAASSSLVRPGCRAFGSRSVATNVQV
jgi:hypothetical protein